MMTEILGLLEKGRVEEAKSLFPDFSDVIMSAIREYEPHLHEINAIKDKVRTKKSSYEREKLPRNWQEYINEVALFFLFGKPIQWKADTEDSEAFEAFKDFLKELRFDSSVRNVKRIAGAETQCAKLYRMFREGDKPKAEIIILSKGEQWDVRPIFDVWGHLLAIGYGYREMFNGDTIEHFDIETPDTIYRCYKKDTWIVERQPNPTGKINLIYYRQEREWAKVQTRIERDERIDSKIADTNNYFADPIAVGTADIIQSIFDPDTPGKLMQMNSPDSHFGYINPPTSPELQREEKSNIRASILQDSFTPDFDFSKMVGLGTLSAEAIKRAMVLGYIKRARNIEIYEPLIDREKNLILDIMMKVTHTSIKAKLERLKKSLTFSFGEPFDDDLTTKINTLSQAVSGGIMSVEEAVKQLALVDNVDDEIRKIPTPTATPTAV